MTMLPVTWSNPTRVMNNAWKIGVNSQASEAERIGPGLGRRERDGRRVTVGDGTVGAADAPGRPTRAGPTRADDVQAATMSTTATTSRTGSSHGRRRDVTDASVVARQRTGS